MSLEQLLAHVPRMQQAAEKIAVTLRA
jgi:hypothetical protein